jgi:hypothetical protein
VHLSFKCSLDDYQVEVRRGKYRDRSAETLIVRDDGTTFKIIPSVSVNLSSTSFVVHDSLERLSATEISTGEQCKFQPEFSPRFGC